ncbi:MAG: hypothetical protein Q3979_09030 [Actinomycetaceae bacterium]|nr:hypothetical protein [Actinomycetaceae bacterium]
MTGVIARLRFGNPTARLAWRDARAHKARTLLAIFLVALPLTVVLMPAAVPITVSIPRDEALNSLPKGVQAVVTGTASTGSIIQDPEGARGMWVDDPNRAPLDAERLKRYLSDGNEAHQVIKSGSLLASTDFRAHLGTALPLEGEGSDDLSGSDVSKTGAPNLIEADQQALKLLLPTLLAGRLPTDGDGVVITSSLAEHLGVSPGETIDLLAPPSQSVRVGKVNELTPVTDGNVQGADVLSAGKRSYRVAGIVSGHKQLVWALPGWLTEAAKAKATGYSTTFLVTGPHPVTWQDAKALNKEGAFAVSRHVLTNYPDKAQLHSEQVYEADVLSHYVGALLGAAIGAILLLGLITPAFVVGAEQQRRILALTAAIGASPRQLARVLTLQGMAVGAAGGILGSAGGLALVWLEASYARPGTPVFPNFPWWALAIAITATTAAGWLATLVPARSVARTPPVESLKRRPQATARKKRRALRSAFFAVALLLSAVACAVFSVKDAAAVGARADVLVIGIESEYDLVVTGLSLWSLLPPALVLVLGFAGAIMLIRVLLEVASRRSFSGRMPPSVRLALREMHAHRGRTLPIIASIAVVITFACTHVVDKASRNANEKDWSATMVAPGHLYLVPEVPVNSTFDASLLKATAKRLKHEGLPIEGALPVYSARQRTLAVLPPDRARCPEGKDVDSASALGYSKKIRCVPVSKAYNPMFDMLWAASSDSLLVMDGDTLRATGMNGAEQAADVLDRGGVVVANATEVDDAGNVQVGTVNSLSLGVDVAPTAQVSITDIGNLLSTSTETFEGPSHAASDVENTQSRPGHFLPRLNGSLAVSPQTAKELGLTGESAPVYVGAVLSSSRPLTAEEVDRAKQVTAQNMGEMVSAYSNYDSPELGSAGDYIVVGLFVMTAALALVLNLWLVRTQMRDELANMHAVGASPALLRRTTVAHAAVVLAIGVPIGAMAGWAFAVFLAVWNRSLALDGPWLHIEGAWAFQAVFLSALVAVGLGLTWIIARPSRNPGLRRREQ